MKKRTSQTAAALLVLVFSALVLTACSDGATSSTSSTSSTTSTSSTSSASSSASDSSEEEEDSSSGSSAEDAAQDDVIGEVTYVGSSSLALDVYEPDGAIADYTDLSGVTLAATGESQTIALETDATYEVVTGGAAEEITLDDVLEGDMVAVTTDSTGAQQVIVLEVAQDSASTAADDSDTASGEETGAESSALEEAAGE